MVTQPSIDRNLTLDLRTAIADLQRVNPWLGLGRFTILGVLLAALTILAWRMETAAGFVGMAAIAGIIYGFWLICTHDMVHGTLTGWRWFDSGLCRAMSYPMFWFVGVYSELHVLHHGWNGIDLRDPERIEWTVDEYERAVPLLRFYARHQWLIDIFLGGGVGLILKVLWQGYQLRQQRSRIPLQFAIDLTGIALFQAIMGYTAYRSGLLLKYVLFWFILERTIGMLLQTRDHLEHYGMWHRQRNYFLTQLYACRNLSVSAFTNWLMGGLPYHAVHHCFPDIPFNQLPLAFARLQEVLERYDYPPLAVGREYLTETLRLIRVPSAIVDAGGTAIATNHQRLSSNPSSDL